MIPEEIDAKYQALSLQDIPEFPGLLRYAHHVGSALIKPEDVESWKKDAIEGKLYDTKKQLDRLATYVQEAEKEGNEGLIQLMKKDAWDLIREVAFTEYLYSAEVSHIPAKKAEYHLYIQKGKLRLSLVGPTEWNKFDHYIASAVYRADSLFELTHSNEKLLGTKIKYYLASNYPTHFKQ